MDYEEITPLRAEELKISAELLEKLPVKPSDSEGKKRWRHVDRGIRYTRGYKSNYAQMPGSYRQIVKFSQMQRESNFRRIV